MAKLTLMALCLVASASAADTFPPSFKPMAIGFAQGFVSDTPDLMSCGMALMQEAANFETAMKDLEKGIVSLNMTGVERALDEIQAVIHGIPAAEVPCKATELDLKATIVALKKLHGPKDLIIHFVGDLFDDGEKIFGELAAAAHAYKTGWDYMTAGQQLGMATRRSLVGEAVSPTPPIAGHKKDMVVGVAVGFVSDSLDLMKCGAALAVEGGDVEQAVKDFGKGIKRGIMHINVTDIEDAMRNFEAAVKGAAGAEATCKASEKEVAADVKAIVAAIKQIHGPRDLLKHIVDNVFDDAENIFGELAAAEHFYRTNNYIGSGRQLGMALRRSLVGEAVPNSTSSLLSPNIAPILV